MKKRTVSLAAVMFCFALAGSATAATYSYNYTEGPKVIAEGDWFYADIDAVGNLGNITDVNVFVNIEHTWMGDLDIYVAHQEQGGSSWKWVQLYNQDGDYRDNMTNVMFDDQASKYINADVPPYSLGFYKPSSSGPDADGDSNLLSFFNGDLAAGTWSLAIFDNSGGDVGTLLNYGVELTTDAVPQNAVPLPGAIVLLGSGLGTVAGFRRLRQK